MDNLWVQAGLIVAIQFAIGYAAAYRSRRQEESSKNKVFNLFAVKHYITTADARDQFDASSEDSLRYLADYLSPEKWENRLADLVGVVFKPFDFIFAIASWGQLLIAAAALISAISAQDAVLYCWFVTAGHLAYAIIGAALDALTFAITGRGAGGPAIARKKFAEVWDRRLVDQRIAERIELDGADWELS